MKTELELALALLGRLLEIELVNDICIAKAQDIDGKPSGFKFMLSFLNKTKYIAFWYKDIDVEDNPEQFLDMQIDVIKKRMTKEILVEDTHE